MSIGTLTKRRRCLHLTSGRPEQSLAVFEAPPKDDSARGHTIRAYAAVLISKIEKKSGY